MAKFNTKKEKVTPTEVNQMGEKAYKLDAKEELVATVLTTFLQKSYYESEDEVVNRIKAAIENVSPEFAAKVALYTRREANMRSSSHLIAGEVAKRISGKEWGKNFYKKICVRPDDMSEILAYYLAVNKVGSGNKIPNAMKKGFKAKLETMDAYLIDKYKMKNRDISLIDLFNLFHPKATQKNAEAFKRFVNGESLDGLYGSKILEKELSAAGQGNKTKEEVKEAKAKAIEAVLNNDKGCPIFNLVRNLRNTLLLAPSQVTKACEQLMIEEKIINSRLLPFRFASAWGEIEKLRYSDVKNPGASEVVFEKDSEINLTEAQFNAKKAEIMSALEVAVNHSCHNIPKLAGNTAILIDHSGSVRGDGGGTSFVSAFSKVTKANIGNLFGTMLMQTQDNVYMGLFGDRLIRVDDIDRSKGILQSNADSFRKGIECGGATENGLYTFLNDCIKNNVKVNNLIIFSDMVIGSGGNWDMSSDRTYGGFQTLFKKFKEVNSTCNVVSVDITQTKGTSVFDKSLGVTQVAGWSNKIFDIIEGATVGYKELIKQIEAIEL